MTLIPRTGLLAALCCLTSAAAYAEPCRYADQKLPECQGDGRLTVHSTNSESGKFAAKLIFLADQLERNVDHKNTQNSYVVGSFANLNNLTETSPLGRLIAENLIHELQVRHWKVYEARLMKNVLINERGEFTLSRDPRQLRDEYQVSGVVAGTYVESDGNLVINARIIDIGTGVVISSGQIQFPANWFTDGLLMEEKGRKAMKIVGG